MKRIQKFILALLLCLATVFPLFGCSQSPAYEIDTVGMTQEEAFNLFKDLYDTPSSYVGKTFRANGFYETATIEGDSKVYELIIVSNGKSHESGEEVELALEFEMEEGKTHLPVIGENKYIQICGVVVAEYEDGTTSLGESKPNGKKIVNVLISAKTFAIMLNQPETDDDHDH